MSEASAAFSSSSRSMRSMKDFRCSLAKPDLAMERSPARRQPNVRRNGARRRGEQMFSQRIARSRSDLTPRAPRIGEKDLGQRCGIGLGQNAAHRSILFVVAQPERRLFGCDGFRLPTTAAARLEFVA